MNTSLHSNSLPFQRFSVSLVRGRIGRPVSGYTLMELLVVCTIIAVLVIAVAMGSRKVIVSAKKTMNMSQMREIGLAVGNWAADNNYGEPMYFANGTGSYPHEAYPGVNSAIAPGNPAVQLFRKNDTSSYVAAHTMFFSPLSTMVAPSVDAYDPTRASETNPWGSFVWLYPATTNNGLTGRQRNAMGPVANANVGAEANQSAVMANNYPGKFPAKYEPLYYVLFRDNSVRLVARNETEWTKWFTGQ